MYLPFTVSIYFLDSPTYSKHSNHTLFNKNLAKNAYLLTFSDDKSEISVDKSEI